MEYFRRALPIARSSMSRWREGIGSEDLERVFRESLGARVLTRKRRDPYAEVYSLDAAEVECT